MDLRTTADTTVRRPRHASAFAFYADRIRGVMHKSAELQVATVAHLRPPNPFG